MTRLDARMARFNQGIVGAGALVAFVFDVPLLVAALALWLSVGVVAPRASPAAWLWRRVVVPSLGVAPPGRLKDGAQVRFAMSVGALFVGVATVILFAFPSVAWLGWSLVVIVSALASLAAVADVCVGCTLYVWLMTATARPAEVDP